MQNTILQTSVTTMAQQNIPNTKVQNSILTTKQIIVPPTSNQQKTRAAIKASQQILYPEVQTEIKSKLKLSGNFDQPKENSKNLSESHSLRNRKKKKDNTYIYILDDYNRQKDTNIRLLKSDKKSQKLAQKQFQKTLEWFEINHAKNIDPVNLKNHYHQSGCNHLQQQEKTVNKFNIKGEEYDINDLIFKEIKKDKVTTVIHRKRCGKKITKKPLGIVYKMVKHNQPNVDQKNLLKQCEWLRNEHEIISRLHHPNIMTSLGYYPNLNIAGASQCGMLMDEANLDLKKLVADIENHKMDNHKLLMSDIKQIFRQIIEPVRYLHTLGLAHNDLKMDNYFAFKICNINRYKKIGDYNLKLADFEMARHSSQIKSYRDLQQYWKLVNISYSSPEVYELIYGNSQVKFDEQKNDIFQLGLILFKILFKSYKPQINYGSNQQVPFLHFQNDPIYENLIKKNYTAFWNCEVSNDYYDNYQQVDGKVKISKIMSRASRLHAAIDEKINFFKSMENCEQDIINVKNLIQDLLAAKPQDRPDINEILQHPWLQENNNSTGLNKTQQVQQQ